MKNLKEVKGVFFLGVLILAGGVFLFLNFRKTQIATNLSPLYFPTLSVPTPSALDITVDWQSCTNEEFGFSIRYPDIFSTGECQVFILGGKGSFAEQAPYIEAVFIFREENPKQLSIVEWLKSPETEQKGEILFPATDSALKIKEKLIAGRKWFSFEESEVPPGFPPDGEFYWATFYKDKVFLVGLTNLKFEDYREIIEKMISTMKFL